jgi:ribonuclease BN (tRNA processing enzyme)
MIGSVTIHAGEMNPATARQTAAVVDRIRRGTRRILLAGQAGVGKSMLAVAVADELGRNGETCWCVSADPGTPGFGVPGTVTLAVRRAAQWEVIELHALCSLDAGRFRLPLVSGVARLAQQAGAGVLLVDGPGVVRGVAGAELLHGLASAAAVDLVVVLVHPGRTPALTAETGALPIASLTLPAVPHASRPGKHRRDRQRTQQWDAYLAGWCEGTLRLDGLRVVGTPPPLSVASAWQGRQVALLNGDHTVAMGEVVALDRAGLRLRLPAPLPEVTTILVRDAQRLAAGHLGTAPPFASEPLEYRQRRALSPLHRGGAGGPRPAGRVGMVDVCLLNGVFGDPLLHLRLRNQRRSLLFDLGEGSRLPARVAHQVTDVFITHAHVDHIAGFLWLLRSRIGDYPPCRLYGPPGLAGHITGLTRGILWDRLQDDGPVFEVHEYDGERTRRFRVRSGQPAPEALRDSGLAAGTLLAEADFRLRATVLSHRSPVLAFAFEPAPTINIRKDALRTRRLKPGPWLAELKRHVRSGGDAAVLELPDGNRETIATLIAELVVVSPAKKLVYATDFADTADNRERLVRLARGAHTLFCEATFRCRDVERAVRTAHLTTRACAEIAELAGAARLVPFHFSRRYEDDPAAVYRELSTFTGRVVVPAGLEPDAVA